MTKEMVTPESPSGVRDYPPEEMIPRMAIINTVREVFERFGFDPLETPAIERRAALTGNDPDFDMDIYAARIYGKDVIAESDTALRFDLTVPLARFVAANPDIAKPFKRYQYGSVWRGEKVQKGRYREFMQFDADSVGVSETQADVEIVWLIAETLAALDVGSFTVRFNSRKILNGLPEYVGFDPSLIVRVLKTLDKFDKIGWEGVEDELRWTMEDGRVLVSGETLLDGDVPAFNDGQIARFKAFSELDADEPLALLAQASELLASDVAQEGIAELTTMVESLRAIGVPEENWQLDFSVARGLGYYTGPVFEAVLDDMPGIGSVFSGGRYDGLVSRFSDLQIPATGASIGIDRLFAALKEMGKIEPKKTQTQAFIMVLDKKFMNQYNALARDLRAAGVRTAIYFGKERFGGQLNYALKQQIPIVIICGGNEFDANTVTVKNTVAEVQKTVARDEFVELVQDELK